MTLPPPAALVGYPTDGQADVPTNVVPFYNVASARIEDITTARFELTSAAGAVVGVRAEQSHVWHADLLLIEPLQPNTTYRLEVLLPDGREVTGVSFTTGSGPFEGTVPPPSASLQHYQFARDVPLTSCSPAQEGTCIALAANWPTEVTHLWSGDEPAPDKYLAEGSFTTNLSGLHQGTAFECVSLRSRAPNGLYSAPLRLCRDDGPLLTLRGSDRLTCTAKGLLQEPAQPRPPSEPEATPATDDAADVNGAHEIAGCSVTAPGRSGAWHPWVLLLAVAAWRQSRREQVAR